jgi:hypothetical protein
MTDNRKPFSPSHHDALTYPKETAKLGTPENKVPLYMIFSLKSITFPPIENVTSPS